MTEYTGLSLVMNKYVNRYTYKGKNEKEKLK